MYEVQMIPFNDNGNLFFFLPICYRRKKADRLHVQLFPLWCPRCLFLSQANEYKRDIES